MIDNLIKAVSLYCDNEEKDFKNSEWYIKLQKLVDELNYKIVCDYAKVAYKKTESIYLGVQIFNEKNENIEIFDEGYLSYSTILVLIDKKSRYKFFSWKDDDFIDSLNWFIKELEIIKKNI